jgi:hypothetical protein
MTKLVLLLIFFFAFSCTTQVEKHSSYPSDADSQIEQYPIEISPNVTQTFKVNGGEVSIFNNGLRNDCDYFDFHFSLEENQAQEKIEEPLSKQFFLDRFPELDLENACCSGILIMEYDQGGRLSLLIRFCLPESDSCESFKMVFDSMQFDQIEVIRIE